MLAGEMSRWMTPRAWAATSPASTSRASGVAGFPGEAVPGVGLGGEVRTEEFDGDVAAEPPIVGAPHLAHPAAAQHVAHLVPVVNNEGLRCHGHA